MSCSQPNCVRPAKRRGMCGTCYERLRVRKIAYGRWDSQRVDAEPVREHIKELQAAGVSLRRLSQLAGVDRKRLQTILHGRHDRGTGPSPHIYRRTAELLLAVPIPEHPSVVAADRALVPAFGARRRLQSLIAFGYTQTYLASRLGMEVRNFNTALRQYEQITARRHRDVCALFDELQLIPGTSVRSRNLAAAEGWRLPFHWDEEALDDPAGKPARRVFYTRERREELVERATSLRRDGFSAAEIAARLEVNERTIFRFLREEAS